MRIAIITPRVIPPFARLDAELISQFCDVVVFPYFGPRSIVGLQKLVKSSDAVIIWFLGRHAPSAVLMARCLRVPMISVIGGFEVAWVSSIGYGIKPRTIKERIIKWMISQSNLVLSVSSFSRNEAVSRFPQYSQKFRLVPNAVNTTRFTLPTSGSRRGVISVGAITRETIGRKSWQAVSDVAARMPDVQFSVIGRVGDSAGRAFVQQLPSNVSWYGYLADEQLISKLQGASLYLQPSIHEAFCVALAEAMACGCFPVVSKLGALPEVVGETGTMLQSLSSDSIEAAIRKGLNRPESDRLKIRDRIVARFSTDCRAQLLRESLNEVLSPKVA